MDDIEKGNKKVSTLEENIIARVLSKLRITISKYIQMLKNELNINSTKSASIQAFARSKSTMSTDERSKKIQHGIDAVMLEISKKENKSSKINEEHIQKIRDYLSKMGEDELLK